LITPSFQSSISSSYLYKICILDPTHVYIVGTGGVFIRYSSGVWEKIIVPGKETTDLFDVQFIDANTGWIVGDNGTIVKYKNGTYTNMTYPNSSAIVKVHFFDETEGWTISASKTFQYKNSAWTNIPSDQVLATDFAFADKNNGLIIGPPYFNGGAGAVISKYSNGTCTRVPTFDFVQDFSGIAMFSSTQGIIIGREGLVLRIGTKPDVVVTGIEENIFGHDVVNMAYSVVPNPASNHIQLYKSGLAIEDQRILVTSLSGLVISDQFIKEGVIDISNLTKGMYFVRLTYNNTTLKFIKE
jgi:hypothetical protein